MSKKEFLERLQEKLGGLPQSEIEERLMFYSELIDDQIEDGLSEEDALNQIGSVDDIATQIISETSLQKIVKEKITPKRKMSVFEIILLILGSPIWIPILLMLIVLVLSIYVIIWSALVALWACFAGCIACAVGGIVGLIVNIIKNNPSFGIALLIAGIVYVGFAIMLFFVCRAATKGIIKLTKKITLEIKKRIM